MAQSTPNSSGEFLNFTVTKWVFFLGVVKRQQKLGEMKAIIYNRSLSQVTLEYSKTKDIPVQKSVRKCHRIVKQATTIIKRRRKGHSSILLLIISLQLLSNNLTSERATGRSKGKKIGVYLLISHICSYYGKEINTKASTWAGISKLFVLRVRK